MNFLTHRFRMKLLFTQLIKIFIFFVGIAAVVITIAFVILDGTIKSYDKKIKEKVTAIEKATKDIAKVKADTKALNIEEIQNQISIVEELFTKKELRFSSILYNIKENTPSTVWYTSLNYKDEVITLDGIASDARDKNAELVVLGMERALVDRTPAIDKQTPIYKNNGIQAEFIKDSESLGNDVNTFRYRLSIYSTVPQVPDSQGGGAQ
jgi:Tfp pilus assembly protein PilN